MRRPSQDLRREADDLHVVPIPELAGHGPEDPGPAGIALVVDEHGRVLVEADVRAVGAAVLLGRADDDRSDDVALLDGGVRDGLLDAGHDDVADPGGRLRRAAHDPDALDRAGARVVGHLQAGLDLDHASPPSDPAVSALPVSAWPASAFPASAFAASSASNLATRPGWAAEWIASEVSTSSAMKSEARPCSPALATIRTSRQRFVAESGRDSSMRTVSPTWASLASSWALNFVVSRMTSLYSRWRARRSTDTTIVLSIRSLTTRPTFVLRCACTGVVAPVIGRRLRRLLRGRGEAAEAALALDREDAGDHPAGLGDRAGVIELSRRQREAGRPEVLLGLLQGIRQLGVGHLSDLGDLQDGHQRSPPSTAPSRATRRVATGSLWLARRIASAASSCGTPAISKRIRPGFTTATQ